MDSSINQAIADKINSYIASVSSGKSTRSELIEAAWLAIKSARDNQCLDDVVITSAEHYLFARWVVGDNFVLLAPLCEAAFPIYDLLKYCGAKYRATRCPVSEYDGHHTLWKEYGCMAGSKDYWNQRSLPPSKVTRYGG
jgi:hypothetical protein